MTTQDQYAYISDWIEKDEIRSLFSAPHLCRNKKSLSATCYRRNDSLLSVIFNNAMFRLLNKSIWYSDNRAMTIIKKATYSGSVPLKFYIIEIITLMLSVIPIAIMFLDFYFSWTNLGAFIYLYISACGISLYLTAKVAKRDWMVHNWDGKNR